MPELTTAVVDIKEYWTIERELVQVAGSADIVQACQALQLVQRDEAFDRVAELRPWKRGGAETYLYAFEVYCVGRAPRAAVAKAMVAATPGIPPEAQLDRRLSRRSALLDAGCPVPLLYGSGNGLYIEEMLDQDLSSFIVLNVPNLTLQAAILLVLSGIADAGFRPLSLIPNIMISNQSAFWVDFGTDLGEPFLAKAGSQHIRNFLIEYESLSRRSREELPLIVNASYAFGKSS